MTAQPKYEDATHFQIIKTKHDSNGNPRRLFALYSVEGDVVDTIEQGYGNRPRFFDSLVQLPSVDVTPTDWRVWLQLGMRRNADSFLAEAAKTSRLIRELSADPFAVVAEGEYVADADSLSLDCVHDKCAPTIGGRIVCLDCGDQVGEVRTMGNVHDEDTSDERTYIVTSDGQRAYEDEHVFDYYNGRWVTVRRIDSSGWFTPEDADGRFHSPLNGERVAVALPRSNPFYAVYVETRPRRESDACERGTIGCSVRHLGADTSCETY